MIFHFEDKISGSIDYYNEKRTGIYLERRHLPWTVGLSAENYKKEKQNVYANVGEVKAHGFDGNIKLRHKINNVDFTIRANMTYGKK